MVWKKYWKYFLDGECDINENLTSDDDHGNEKEQANMELDMKEIKWKWTWKFKEKIDTI